MQMNRLASFVVSSRFRMVALATVCGVVLGMSSGCKTGPSGPINVPLQYRPKHSDPITGTFTASDLKVFIAVNDKRPQKDEIGTNVEDATPVQVFASSDKTPGQYLKEVLAQELGNFGVQLVDAQEAADRVITLDLNKFWVQEDNNYSAEINAIATVKDKGGNQRWRGSVGGQGKTFGRSKSAENYNECFSDAARRTVAALVANPGFTKELSK